MDLIPLDYPTLRVIWWLLLGVLLIGFAIMDGFDLGIGALLPFVARNDAERRVVINVIGPVWEGNQVWLVLGGGAIFAAWPALYAVSFSGFYLAMFLILLALILRPVGFKFRSKVQDPRWRATWDWALFVGGFVPALVFGIAVGNVLQGVPFGFDATLRPYYLGGLLGLLNPFALLCGLVSLAMLVAHGASLLAWKTDGLIAARARAAGAGASLCTIVLFAVAGLWVAYGLEGHVVTGGLAQDGPSNPLRKTVELQAGGLLFGYAERPWSVLAPILGFAGAAACWLAVRRRLEATAFLASATAIFGIVATAGLSLFPFILPSSHDPAAGLTVWDASSSPMTLWVMLLATMIFLPPITLYTAWVYRVMRGKVSTASVARNPNAY